MVKEKYVGQRLTRTDSLAKATGAAKYTGDIWMNRRDMLYAKALFPPYGHARIVSIDTSAAQALEGVVTVMTADDLPGKNGYGGMVPDKPVIAKDEVLYEGDPVALVAAETKEAAEKAVKLIKVEYEPLEGYDDPAFMLDTSSPMLHTNNPFHKNHNISDEQIIKKGDVEKAFKEADVIIDNWYKTPLPFSHIFLSAHHSDSI